MLHDKFYVSVGIVLVNWKSTSKTNACLDSIYNSTCLPKKIVVVDNSLDFVSYNNRDSLVVLKADRNLGFAEACNWGIKLLNEFCVDYIWVLNNDTIVESNCLEMLVRHSDLNMFNVYSGLIKNNDNTIWFSGGKKNKWLGTYSNSCVESTGNDPYFTNFISGCCMFTTPYVFRCVGMFPNSFFMYSEDEYWCRKAKNHGINFYVIPKALIYHDAGSSQVNATSNHRLFIEQIKIRNKVWCIKLDRSLWKRLCYLIFFTLLVCKNVLSTSISVKIKLNKIKGLIVGICTSPK